MPEQGSEQPSGGLLQSLRKLGATLIALVQTRLELLATDLEEERLRLLQILFWAAGALFFFGVGMLILTLLAVLLLWDEHHIGAIIALATVFFAIGVGLTIGVRNRMRARSRIFASSVEELAKDREELISR